MKKKTRNEQVRQSRVLPGPVIVSLVALALVAFVVGCSDPIPPQSKFEAAEATHGTTITTARELGTWNVELPGHGEVNFQCNTCHGAELPAKNSASPHEGMALEHGVATCNSCHDKGDRTHLRLADGTKLVFEDAMRLCEQCHGPQTRDYRHGSHGGMNGYWDLSKGPRERHSCLNCHDPHKPAYPKVMPAPGPKDRFLGTPAH